jgi:aminoglycoside 6'-N-acetyltransferase I
VGVEITDLTAGRRDLIEQAAALLLEGFSGRSPAWPTLDAARAEVVASLAPDRVSRVALDPAGRVLGWIGGIPQYEGHVWELHPLVVAQRSRGQGIGRGLVEDLERIVRDRRAWTLWTGSDDENDETSLSGVNLYADIPGAIRNVRNRKRHPYEFYQRLGFQIVGVMPDANGPGRPDIFLAKRVRTA